MNGKMIHCRASVTLVVLVLIILAMLVAMAMLKPPEQIELTDQEQAEEALSAYKIAAWNYVQTQGETRGLDLKETIFRPDWDWYENNYESLFTDTFKLMDAVNLQAQKQLKMTIVMQNILKTGVHRPDTETLDVRRDGESTFIFRIKQIAGQDERGRNFFEEFDVKVVKEKSKWKVQEFGGALPIIKNMGTAGGIGLPAGF